MKDIDKRISKDDNETLRIAFNKYQENDVSTTNSIIAITYSKFIFTDAQYVYISDGNCRSLGSRSDSWKDFLDVFN